MRSSSPILRGGLLAVLAIALSAGFQWTVVHTSCQGNWTGLFLAGDRFHRPPEIEQREYVFHDSSGYDGQFYQLIAHDPLLRHQYDTFIDAPRLRYRRILMPGLAHLLAAGQLDRIDAAFIVVCWLFIGLGTFCLAQLAADAGRSPAWGLLFLILPATLLAIERMTLDISLAALAAAALLAARRQRWLLLWIALAAAPLAKETGVLLILGVVAWLLRQKMFRLAALLSLTPLPALAWDLFVQLHTQGDYSTSGFRCFPFFAFLTQPLDPGISRLVFRILLFASASALLWAAIRSVILALRQRLDQLELWFAFLFSALLLLFQTDAIWSEPDGFTRIYSPVLICLLAATWRRGFVQTLVTFGLVTLPIGLQLGVRLLGPLARPYLGF